MVTTNGNYVRRGISLLSFIYFLLCSGAVIGQSNQGSCLIRVPSNVTQQQRTMMHRNATQMSCSANSSISSIQPNMAVVYEMAPLSGSDCIDFTDFALRIPEGAIIEGVRVKINGTVIDNNSKLQLTHVNLLSTDGPIGENKAGRSIVQDTHNPTDALSWDYGYEKDLWNADLTREILNNEDFGVRLQIENPSAQSEILIITTVELQVTYLPLYTHCENDLLTFFVDKQDETISYKWTYNPTYWLVSENNENYIVNLRAPASSIGQSEICVDVLQEGEVIDHCCRSYIYDDCRSKGTIGDLVWEDANKNGLQDNNELGVSDILLNLYSDDGVLVSTTTTDADGRYVFDDVFKGSYYIDVDLTENYSTTMYDPADSDSNSDFNFSGQSLQSMEIIVEAGEDVSKIDFGIVAKSIDEETGLTDSNTTSQFFATGIYGTVWCDNNRNNIFDAGDPNLNNILVKIFTASGEFVAQQLSDSTGSFMFNVEPGEYYLWFNTSFGKLFVEPSDDSAVNGANGSGTTSTFTYTGEKLNVNAGLIYVFGDLTGTAYCDDNQNGVQDPNEIPVPNITVKVYTTRGSFVAEYWTKEDGVFLAEDIYVGDYYVVFEDPEGRGFVINENTIIDNTYRPSSTGIIELDSEGVVSGINAGLANCIHEEDDPVEDDPNEDDPNEDDPVEDDPVDNAEGFINGDVWCDGNRNNIKDEQDELLNNILVRLYNSADEVIRQTITDVNGEFFFDDLSNGLYYVMFNLAEEKEFVEGSSDSDVSHAFGIGTTNLITIQNDAHSISAGQKFMFGGVSGFAWCDSNQNGIKDLDEDYLQDITVTIYDENGIERSEEWTKEGGYFLFDELLTGTYYIVFSDDRFTSITIADAGDPMISSHVTNVNGRGSTTWFNITKDTVYESVNVGFIDCSTGESTNGDGTNGNADNRVSGEVWCDGNRNNIKDDQDELLFNILVELFNVNGEKVDQVVTDTSGSYTFKNIENGQYYLDFKLSPDKEFVEESLDSDVTHEFGEGTTGSINLIGNDIVIDAGQKYRFGTVTGFAWCDSNGNGIFESGEDLLEDITVEIFDVNGTSRSAEWTVDNGVFIIDEIIAGDYYLVFSDPRYSAFTISSSELNSNNSSVTHINGEGSTNVFTINGENMGMLNVGYTDCEGADGAGTDGEGTDGEGTDGEGADGAGADGEGADGESTDGDGTDGEGADGEGTDGEGTDGEGADGAGTDGDGTDGDGTDGAGTDGAGTDGAGTDGAGTDGAGTDGENTGGEGTGQGSDNKVSGEVWCDVNRNNLKDDQDELLFNILVELFNVNGEKVDQTLTDASGSYTFGNIDNGQYYVDFKLSPDKEFVEESLDSDITHEFGEGTTDLINLNGNDIALDAGQKYKFGSVTGFAWCDTNGNGIFEDGEDLLEDITVEIFDVNGISRSVEWTVDDGIFVIDEIVAGDYYLIFSDPRYNVFTNNSSVTHINGEGSTDIFTINGDNMGMFNVGYTDCNGTDGDGTDGEGADGDGTDGDGTDGEGTNGDGTDGDGTDGDGTGGEGTDGDGTDGDGTDGEGTDGDGTDGDGTDGDGTDGDDTDGDGTDGDGTDGDGTDGEGSISGITWCDFNNDGMRRNDDAAKVGIVIELYTDTGELVSSTVSGEDGTYSINNISAGEYYLVFERADSLLFTMSNVGAENIDSDVTGENGPGSTGVFTIFEDEALTQMDAGYIDNTMEDADLMGEVWCDENRDGIKDDSERRINAILVSLYNASGQKIAEQSTNPDGLYAFAEVNPGQYYIRFAIGEAKEFTISSIGDDEVDSDVTGEFGDGTTDLFDVIEDDQTRIDCGQRLKVGSLCGITWEDTNEDGIRDLDEFGLANVTVSIFDASAIAVMTVTSDDQGNFNFENVPIGSYYLQFDAVRGKMFSPANQSDETTDSDVTGANGQGTTDVFFVEHNIKVENLGAGYATDINAMIGRIIGVVWFDTDENGLRSMDEDRVEGAVVSLYTSDGELYANTTTDTEGNYMFDELPLGGYYVQVISPLGYTYTIANTGDDLLDSDITEEFGDGTSSQVVLTLDEDLAQIDAGVIRVDDGTGTNLISGVVWHDADLNGLRVESEERLERILVTLYNNLEQPIDNVLTNTDGYYEFTDVASDEYFVTFTINAIDTFTVDNVGEDDAIDSDVTNSQLYGSSDKFTVMGGDSTTIDAGIILGDVVDPATLTGVVWKDEDENGIQDEPNIEYVSDVRVLLFTEDMFLFNITLTVDGRYFFDRLPTGNYYAVFSNGRNTIFTIPDASGDDTIDSDVTNSIERGSTDVFDLAPNEDKEYVDAGLIMESDNNNNFLLLTGLLWDDINANGMRETFEPRLEGYRVELVRASDGMIITTTETNRQGAYIIETMGMSDYFIRILDNEGFVVTVVDPNINAYMNSDITNANGDWTSDSFTLHNDAGPFVVDAGMYQIAGLSGQVWMDQNRDNVRSEDDEAAAGITVFLYTSRGVLVNSTETSELGMYNFDNIAPGRYYVEFVLDQGDDFIEANVGDDTVDSDVTQANGIIGRTDIYTIRSGDILSNIDAGIQVPDIPQDNSISGVVWQDDGDGLRQNDELLLEGVEVSLRSRIGEFLNVAITDATGRYTFVGLDDTPVYISIDVPDGYDVAPANAGDDTIDSDADESFGSGTTAILSPAGGDGLQSVDFGLVNERGIISGSVWRDVDRNGGFEINEPMISGIPIRLIDRDGIVIDEVASDLNGEYEFLDIAPGAYQVEFSIEENNTFTLANAANEDVDSEVTMVDGLIGRTDEITVTNKENIQDIDAGVISLLGVIEGIVWFDVDGNGAYSLVEDRVPFVDVSLFTEDGTLVQEATATDIGVYIFDDIAVGNYYLVFESREGTTFTPPNTTNNQFDSDVTSDIVQGSTSILQIGESDYRVVNAGYITNMGGVAGVVWLDSDSDGIRQPDETFLSGIEVCVRGNSVTGFEQCIMTNDRGAYNFTDLAPGSYTISYDISEGFGFTFANVGQSDAVDSDLVNREGIVFNIPLLGDQYRFDVGLVRESGTISGTVWRDENINGLREAGEERLNAVTVFIKSTDVAQEFMVTTDAQGRYTAEGIPFGNWFVEVVPTGELDFTPANIGNDDSIDSDIVNDPTEGVSEVIQITSTSRDIVIDAGFIEQTTTLAGRVWSDIDEDGLRDSDEEEVPDIAVSLFTANGDLVSSTTTNGNGEYTFTGLDAGDYYVVMIAPDDTAFTNADQGPDPTVDSDITGAVEIGSTDIITINQGTFTGNIDGGLIMSEDAVNGEISGLAWIDRSMDGVRQDNEELKSDVIVSLRNRIGEIIDVQVTDENGQYRFGQVNIEPVYITVELPDGFFPTASNAGDDTIDSDIDNTNGPLSSDFLFFSSRPIVDDLDIGVMNSSLVSGYVWRDLDLDGTKDLEEPGIENIQVDLFASDGTFISTLLSEADGRYKFFGISAGTYYVEFTVSDNDTYTVANVGGEFIDSDVVVIEESIGRTDVFSIDEGGSIDFLNAGVISELVVIEGITWFDEDKDGINTIQEDRTPFVTVSLFTEAGELVQETTSTDIGSYILEGILPGRYYLVFEEMQGLEFTMPMASGDQFDSDVTSEITLGSTSIIELVDSDYRVINVGYVSGQGSVSGLIWLDENVDGMRQNSEMLLPNIEVCVNGISDPSFQICMTTDANGEYSNSDIPLGSYIIVYNIPDEFGLTFANQGASDAIDSDLDDKTGLNINVSEGGLLLRYDVGLTSQTGSVSGIIWQDIDQDGLRDDDEPRLSGRQVSVRSTDVSQEFDVTTNVNGEYSVDGLPFGNWFAYVLPVDDFDFTIPNAGNDDTIDSDITNIVYEGSSNPVELTQANPTAQLDAGVIGESTFISGTVWSDDNNDGIKNVGEPRIEGVKIDLYNELNELLNSTLTNSNGDYFFRDLMAGDYYIVAEMLDDRSFTQSSVGADNTLNSDITGSITAGSSDIITVLLGGMATSIDIGYIGGSTGMMEDNTLSGVAWIDRNIDGLRQDSELPKIDIEIQLRNEIGEIIGTTKPDSLGAYRFENIDLPSVYISVSVPQGFFTTTANVGDDDTIDSDIDDTSGLGTSTLVTFDNTGVATLDIGVFSTSIVSGYIWRDIDQDGTRDVGEPGHVGVLVELFTPDGELVDSIRSGQGGRYKFIGNNPSDYYVQVTLEGQNTFTEPNIGGEFVDSDITIFDGPIGRTDVFTIGERESIDFLNAGTINQLGIIEGITWYDEDGDGVNIISEDRAPFTSVSLRDRDGNVIADTLTSDIGVFLFEDIPAGDYYLIFEDKIGFDYTIPNAMGDQFDSSITSEIETGSTALITLTASGYMIVNGGYIANSGAVSGIIWLDGNVDGVRQTDEARLDGIVVCVNGVSDPEFERCTTTDEDGYYSLTGIEAGDYLLNIEILDEFGITFANIGGSDEVDSDLVDRSGMPLNIPEGGKQERVDVGLTGETGQITGVLWEDTNSNGLREDDEPRVSGQTVAIRSIDVEQEFITITDNQGSYSIDGLPFGDWFVYVEPIDGFRFTTPNVGNDDSIDSDISSIVYEGSSDRVSISEQNPSATLDAGIITGDGGGGGNAGSISGTIWEDSNADGIRNSDEPLLRDVEVQLFDDQDRLLLTVQTDENGAYIFQNLQDGSYYIVAETRDGFSFTIARLGGDTTVDSDITNAQATGSSDLISLNNSSVSSIDVGYVIGGEQRNLIGNRVWIDMNGDGLQDANEPGINDVMIHLIDKGGNLVFTTRTMNDPVTGEPGTYIISDVESGEYWIQVTLPAGYFFTRANMGSDELDSDITGDNGEGTTSMIIVTEGMFVNNIDVGLILTPGAIGDYLWSDANGNGLQDNSEMGLNNMIVFLKNEEGTLIDEVVTRTNPATGRRGFYNFENVDAGMYYVEFDLPIQYISTIANIGSDDDVDSDLTDAFGVGTTDLFELDANQMRMDIDGGVLMTGAIGDFVWRDTNENGIQDEGEPGFGNVMVQLLDQTTREVLRETTTDSNGEYAFTGLPTGNYSLIFFAPDGFVFTERNAGPSDKLDSDIKSDGTSPRLTLPEGTSFLDLDAGLIEAPGFTEESSDNNLAVDGQDGSYIQSLPIRHNSVLGVSTAIEATSVAEVTQVKLYPNPAQSILVYQDYGQVDAIDGVTIFDSQGQWIKSGDINAVTSNGSVRKLEIVVSDLPAGLYLLQILKGEMVTMHKFSVSR